MKTDFKQFFDNMMERFQLWMRTRYGMDDMSKGLLITGFVLNVLARILHLGLLSLLSSLMLLIGLFRMFAPSATWQKRRREEQIFQSRTRGLRSFANYIRLSLTDKEHKYLMCSSCRKYLRVPRGQGSIFVNCPYCKNKTKTKS